MFAFEVYDERKVCSVVTPSLAPRPQLSILTLAASFPQSLYDTHFNSPAMQQFLEGALPVMSTGFDLSHYSAVGGVPDAPGDGRQCGVMYDIKIVAKSPEARAVLKDRLAALAKKIEADTDKEQVLTWMAFECLDNDRDLRVYGRFKDRAAMARVNEREDVVAFWKESRDNEIERIEQRGYVPNGKGWLHR
jgi:quinol monooxygenase YgiN